MNALRNLFARKFGSDYAALFSASVWISALGYFVDSYDLLLFSIVRVSSLRDIGVPETELLSNGVLLINAQMAGLLIGGFVWGYFGDRIGRLKVLFASILLYSAANLANAFVSDIPAYGALRFVSGIGLAGELGLAVTLLTEILPARIRGFGAVIIACMGLCGAASAAWLAQRISWRWAYAVGGIMGFLLLFARTRMRESRIFVETRASLSRSRFGNLKLLFSRRERATRYAWTIAVGLPLWFTSGVLITFSPEIAKALGIAEEVSPGQAVLYCYGFATIGDLLAGIVCQRLKSRKKAIAIFMSGTFLGSALFLTAFGQTAAYLYFTCSIIGLAGGYWALFSVTAAEQFGTNLRATVATSIPNLVRGAVIPLTFLFKWGIPYFGTLGSAAGVGALTLGLAAFGLTRIPETFHIDLNRVEG